MKSTQIGYLSFVGAIIALSGFCTEKAGAQVNESRVLRQASGVYKGVLSNSMRVRNDPVNGPETYIYDSSTGKVRLPVTESKFNTSMTDDELGGTGQAIIKGDGKNAKVTRQGNKVNYSITKGSFATVGDGHNPIQSGTAKGGMVHKGNSWVGELALVGYRVDNDSLISTFTCKVDGKD